MFHGFLSLSAAAAALGKWYGGVDIVTLEMHKICKCKKF